MRNLVRGSLVLAVGVALLALPRVASAHYTGYRHRHVGPRLAYGPPPIDRPGLYLGISGVGDIVANQARSPVSDFISSGGGFGLMCGFRFGPFFALEFGYGQTLHNTQYTYDGYAVDYLALHAVTIDAKFVFPNRSNVRPYAQAGAGLYALTREYTNGNLAEGGGLQLGGGLDIWLNPWWTIGARMLYHGIGFGSIDNSKPFLSTISLDANLQVHF